MKLRYGTVLLALLVAAACGDGTSPEVQTSISASSGNNQTAVAGAVLADPAVVRVTQDGAAASGITVTWAVTAGGGSVAPATSTTDASGNASTVWTIGAVEGANVLEARLDGANGSPVVFSATGTAGTPPTTASVSVGDNFFNPTSTTIAEGGTVTWTWAGAANHNVTFSSGTNSATQTSGMFSRDFPTAGSFDYLCTVHGAAMSGTVVVQ